MSYQVIARKYRPQKFLDVVGQDHITRTLQNAIAAGRLHHAYLFTGVRGVGKTTLARIFSKALNCEKGPSSEPCNVCSPCLEITGGNSMDVQEIDGASNTGVDDVREIRERVKYLPSHGRYKIYIIDEVHMLSTAAFNALLKTLEEPPAHVIFIFATTEPHKIPATILSRCQRYDFRRIPLPKIINLLKNIAKSENVEIDEDSLHIIAREAEGSIRDAESLFDQALAYAGKKVTYNHLKELLGFMDRQQIFTILKAIVEKDTKTALSIANDLFNCGANLNRFTVELLQQFRNLMVLKAGGNQKDIELPPDELKIVLDLLSKVTSEECQIWFNILYKGAEDVARAKSPKILLDVLLVKMTQVRPVESVEALLEKLEGIKGGCVVQTDNQTASTKTVNKPVVSATGETFSEFLNWLQTNKPQVASILSHASNGNVDNALLTINFPSGSLYGDMLTEPERKSSVEKLASTFFKKNLRVNVEFKRNGDDERETKERRIKEETEKNRIVKEETLAHELVREATNLFGAEIKEIKVK